MLSCVYNMVSPAKNKKIKNKTALVTTRTLLLVIRKFIATVIGGNKKDDEDSNHCYCDEYVSPLAVQGIQKILVITALLQNKQ